MSNLESRRKTFNEICKKNIIVIIMIVFLCPILGFSYATFITNTSDYRSNEMYIGKLLYSISTYIVPDSTPESITYSPTNKINVPANSNITAYVRIESLNQVSSFYKLVYSVDSGNNSDIVVYYAKDQNEKAVSGSITTEKTSTIILINSSDEDREVSLDIAGGYNTNTLEDVNLPSGYAYIDTDYYRYSYETVAIYINGAYSPDGLHADGVYDLTQSQLNTSETILQGKTNCTNGATPTYNRNTKLLTIAPSSSAGGQVPTKCVLYFSTVASTNFALAIINDNKACGTSQNREICPDNINSLYVESRDGIDFSTASSLVNGQGLYSNYKNGGDGNNYYFRGGSICAYSGYNTTPAPSCVAAGGVWSGNKCSLHLEQSACPNGVDWIELNNNVMFGGHAWKIIRVEKVVEGDETKYYTHLLYNGSSTRSVGSATNIALGAWYDPGNYNQDDAAFLGYMYNGTEIAANFGSIDIQMAQDNAENSHIKSILEAWYDGTATSGTECAGSPCNFALLSPNLSANEFNSRIANRVFCNDREIISGDGYSSNDTIYAGWDRINTNRTPSFSCTQTNDQFTLEVSRGGTLNFGNNKTQYPIGLITADELLYAGAVYGSTSYTTYVHSGAEYWTMTPSQVFGSASMAMQINNNSPVAMRSVDGEKGIRPVIVLDDAAEITSGNGSINTPYLIKTTD